MMVCFGFEPITATLEALNYLFWSLPMAEAGSPVHPGNVSGDFWPVGHFF